MIEKISPFEVKENIVTDRRGSMLLRPDDLCKGMLVLKANERMYPLDKDDKVVPADDKTSQMLFFLVFTAPGVRYGELFLYPYSIHKGEVLTDLSRIPLRGLSREAGQKKYGLSGYFLPLLTMERPWESTRSYYEELRFVAFLGGKIIYSNRPGFQGDIESFGREGVPILKSPGNAYFIRLLDIERL